MRMSPPVVAIVVPCFNEQDVLPETARRLGHLMQSMVANADIDAASCVWFVDDGSRDRTWALIEALSADARGWFRGIKLSRNKGHQIALLAGLMIAEGEALISIDADLQDDMAVIPKMIAAYASGQDVVYGVRASRDSDSRFKRLTAETYYRLLAVLDVEVVFNHADFRLMSRRAVEALRGYPESSVFLRGLVPQLGFPSTTVSYARHERFAGESKYPLGKMAALAWQGVTSFSAAPLRLITAMGIAVSLGSLGIGFWALIAAWSGAAVVPGWASTVIPLFLISGVQLLSLGVIGEYVAKIFIETKRRPLYLVEQLVGRAAAPQERAALAGLHPGSTTDHLTGPSSISSQATVGARSP